MKRNVLMPNFAKRNGLVTIIAQDKNTREILMVAFTDEIGFLETMATGEAVYYSTSRGKRWRKGEESGNIQKVSQVLIDCDGDAVIYMVEQIGEGACHTSKRSCFYRSVLRPTTKMKGRLEIRVISVTRNIQV